MCHASVGSGGGFVKGCMGVFYFGIILDWIMILFAVKWNRFSVWCGVVWCGGCGGLVRFSILYR